MCLFIACGNLMVNIDQQHNVQRQTQNKTGNVHITVILWWGCLTVVDVEKQ